VQILSADLVHVPAAEDDEAIETFLLNRLDAPLYEGVRVRGAELRDLHRDSLVPQGLIHGLTELRVPVVLDDGRRCPLGVSFLEESFRLPLYPGLVRLERGWR
jgi:hypothetical protein